MAATKKASSSGKARSSTSKEAFGKKLKGENFYHDAKKVGKRKMLNSGKPVYDRDGKIKEAAAFQKTEAETDPGRVQPDRRWFGMSPCSTRKVFPNVQADYHPRRLREYESHLSDRTGSF